MATDTRARQEIGQRIKRLRISKGLTIKELAQNAHMSAGYLSEVERGGSALSAEKLAALAGCLGSTVDYLLTGISTPSHAFSDTRIPAGLAQAAEILELTYVQTAKLLAGKRSLVARRGSQADDWSPDNWIKFYEKVKQFL